MSHGTRGLHPPAPPRCRPPRGGPPAATARRSGAVAVFRDYACVPALHTSRGRVRDKPSGLSPTARIGGRQADDMRRCECFTVGATHVEEQAARMADMATVDRVDAGDHACLTFSDAEERLDLVAAFVRDGL